MHRVPDPATIGAAALLRAVGLLPDGPQRWGRPITSKAPGVYVVELAAPLPAAPLELTRIGKWVERLPELRLDGERPTSRQVAARLASLWLPGATVLYAGATSGSVGGRVLALAHHVLGDRRPHADGQWLHALRSLDDARVWWAETASPEEYLDGILDAFAAAAAGDGLADRPSDALLLPWANMRRPTGERQAHGLTGTIAPDTAPAPPPPAGTRITVHPDGVADGADPDRRGTGTVRRAPRVAGSVPGPQRRTTTADGGAIARGGAGLGSAGKIEPVPMTADGLARLEAELHDLTQVRRPGVVARIKAARELGDLKENAEYQAAREEQSFLEGRVRLLEERLRHAVLIEETGSGRATLGSTLVVELDGTRTTYVLTGSADADPANGRISTSSPVGAAFVGAVAGADVDVRTPRGTARYRVIEVR